jgi:hypothetical protein
LLDNASYAPQHARMEYFLISLLTGWLFYKTIMLTHQDDGLFPAVSTGITFFALTGMAFILGGWWIAIGAVFFIMALGSFTTTRFPHLRIHP